uniref:PDZ domain-containing protein n=1 Tax=Alexandrium andersonii TaxID=327968 RepID=A0A7S2F003_9DINO|mmetsp:Transcript_11519/g.26204  ORF Transcript_11519/g.26204 Transcript_11519/m.26204 type:complete len:222 (+) Transcript_11519:86-751(+)
MGNACCAEHKNEQSVETVPVGSMVAMSEGIGTMDQDVLKQYDKDPDTTDGSPLPASNDFEVEKAEEKEEVNSSDQQADGEPVEQANVMVVAPPPEEDQPAIQEGVAVVEPEAGDTGLLEEGPKASFLFELPDGTKKTVVITRRPFGVGFKKTTPLKVQEVRAGQAGAEAGIEAGWALLEVDGKSVADMPQDRVVDDLQKSCAALPHINKATNLVAAKKGGC